MGTILVVDDDEQIREFLRKSFGALATVVEAADGAQAIAAARWSHPDVIVMDLDMPVLDGFEAARQLKSDPTFGDPILVAMTGNEAANAVPRARAAGYSYFVRKETNARSFVETIARLLEEAQARLRPHPTSAAAVPEAVQTPSPAAAIPRKTKKATRASPKRATKAKAKAAKPARKGAAARQKPGKRAKTQAAAKR